MFSYYGVIMSHYSKTATLESPTILDAAHDKEWEHSGFTNRQDLEGAGSSIIRATWQNTPYHYWEIFNDPDDREQSRNHQKKFRCALLCLITRESFFRFCIYKFNDYILC